MNSGTPRPPATDALLAGGAAGAPCGGSVAARRGDVGYGASNPSAEKTACPAGERT